ncbi:SDR family oxidoreductase [Cryptosporangium aurantiacum]|uniref:NAD(P)H-binding n=1 Tax=Cryptosporangium aurantiacum TaxID=134849 RepID=A0A1M7HJK2_9ACTN|nr:SDR family oxidoreductase [Cryptosporangium aurantiacum]SHM28676.1 NAD(P)H-binding [Cryptosporangium aurantiacum]
MRVVIAGGHGKIALRLAKLLSADGDQPVGLIRNPAHVADVEAAGAEAVVLDLEKASVDDVAAVVRGADAVVFAAGAGPGSGAARKDTVDRGAAALLADAAEAAGVDRYLMVSSVGAGKEPPPDTEPVFAAYLRAKTAADEDLQSRKLAWTIIRPGHLTDVPGTGRVALDVTVERGSVPRDDVAEVLLAALRRPFTAGLTLELIEGTVPIVPALTDAAGDRA